MMAVEIIDFDSIDEWFGSLESILYPLMTDTARRELAESKLQYIEDTRDLMLELTNRDATIDAVLDWLRSKRLMAYHGTRTIEPEDISIWENGLLPLSASARHIRISRALTSHPGWHEVSQRLGELLQSHGPGNREGKREGQVHLTLSMTGLVYGFNHYLSYGSEFDQHVARKLLGQDGMKLLSLDGEPKVVKVAVPGEAALKAAHPFISMDDIRARGDIPNIVKEFLEAWSFKLSHPKFQSGQLKLDCGMIFWNAIPSNWIVEIERVDIPIN